MLISYSYLFYSECIVTLISILKNQQLELFGIEFEDDQSQKLKYQIESTQYLVNQYIKQTSPEYIAKMQDKINRHKKKLEMLYEVGIAC